MISWVLLLGLLAGCTGGQGKEDDYEMQGKLYKLWLDNEATQDIEGFMRQSLPLGNGYMGLNVFGGVKQEMISVTENSLVNTYVTGHVDELISPEGEQRCVQCYGGLCTMAKMYIDFDHTDAQNYQRSLTINDATAQVSYDYDGVTYTRDYFSSYPDKVSVVRLSASKKGKLSFTLCPEAAYVREYLYTPGDGMGKTGKAVAEGDTVTVSGIMEYYGTRYEGQFKVIPTGGNMTANKNGTITVTDATSAVILIAVGTNYQMEPESFVQSYTGSPARMDVNEDPHEKVQAIMDAAAQKDYSQLLSAHRQDYTALFSSAQIDLGGTFNETVTTEQLLTAYKTGSSDPYLEELLFQYGRYLMIASSRVGALPSNLQGVWSCSDVAAWSGGYWHNLNLQMNYWSVFATNLEECFQSYVDYNETFRKTAQSNADIYLKNVGATDLAPDGTGENGWAIGTGTSPYVAERPSMTAHSGPGTGAFTSLLFWDYYDFTRDETILKEHTYPAIEGMAKFLSKTLKEYEDGKWLVANSASPENANNYHTVGTAFDQQMVYENHKRTLEAAELLGYTAEDYPILATLQEQVDKLDPVNIGYSGQVKEYREENYYGEFGETNHRHISQLVGLFPGTSINGETDAWLEAAAVSLESRGDSYVGWARAHRMLCWARIKNADAAYDMVQKMLKENTASNMWSIYNKAYMTPFQIDANFGYTAGVAEMLVQSQAGYIEFLPALPEAWATGSFTGLTTRGNFEVDATWENGLATGFTIRSGSGVDCSVYYPNVSKATVVDSKGNAVSFTVDEDNRITFATVEGESYTISNIPSHTKIDTLKKLTISGTQLQWEAVENAASYKVYRAVEDAATYELLAENATELSYTYADASTNGKRVTLRVTAVAADGTESAGKTVVIVP